MRVAVNLLTDHPDHPSGAHWFWTRMIPQMAGLMTGDEEFRLLVSQRVRPTHQGYGPRVGYLTFPWSNESPGLRTLSEQLYAPVRLPLAKIDVFSTLIAPRIKPAPGLVVHFKTMHAYTSPQAIRWPNRMYRQLNYPHTARVADAIVINSESLREEVTRYLDVDPEKLRMIPEAVDHELFRPGDPDEARAHVAARYGVTRPFVLFVSSLFPYKNADGLVRAFAAARTDLGDRQLVLVGPERDPAYSRELRSLVDRFGLASDVVWVGGVPLEETVAFYRCADVFAYPSHNETFGLPLLEAMACGCPVVTSNTSAMPETAGGAALLADPASDESLTDALRRALSDGAERDRLRAAGLARAADFNRRNAARQAVAVYEAALGVS